MRHFLCNLCFLLNYRDLQKSVTYYNNVSDNRISELEKTEKTKQIKKNITM